MICQLEDHSPSPAFCLKDLLLLQKRDEERTGHTRPCQARSVRIVRKFKGDPTDDVELSFGPDDVELRPERAKWYTASGIGRPNTCACNTC